MNYFVGFRPFSMLCTGAVMWVAALVSGGIAQDMWNSKNDMVTVCIGASVLLTFLGYRCIRNALAAYAAVCRVYFGRNY